jgi:hypothetical protein
MLGGTLDGGRVRSARDTPKTNVFLCLQDENRDLLFYWVCVGDFRHQAVEPDRHTKRTGSRGLGAREENDEFLR